MNFIGVDLSLTGTGIVILNNDGEITTKRIIKTLPSNGSIDARISNIKNIIHELITPNDKDNDVWYVEGLSYQSKGRGMLNLAGLHYVITVMLFDHNAEYKEIPPSTLKKWATGKGNSKKELMILHAYKRWGIEFSDNNLCDAFMLARMAYEERN